MNRWLNFHEIKQSIPIVAVLGHYQWKYLRRRGIGCRDAARFTAGSGRTLSMWICAITGSTAFPAKHTAECWISWLPWNAARSARQASC